MPNLCYFLAVGGCSGDEWVNLQFVDGLGNGRGNAVASVTGHYPGAMLQKTVKSRVSSPSLGIKKNLEVSIDLD